MVDQGGMGSILASIITHEHRHRHFLLSVRLYFATPPPTSEESGFSG